jgi:uncharacterized membrane protein
MKLFFLLLLLVAPYLILTLAGKLAPEVRIAAVTRARIGLTLFFAVTSVGHLIRTVEMAPTMPPPMPYSVELTYITGILEMIGAIAIWIPGLIRLAGIGLILMLICLSPENIYSAINPVEFGGNAAGENYLLHRVPIQLFVIIWTYFATDLKSYWRQPREA